MENVEQNPISTQEAEPKTKAMYNYALQNVNLVPSAAKTWVDHHLDVFNEVDFTDDSFKRAAIDFLNEPEHEEYRLIMNFLIPLFNMETLAGDLMDMSYGGYPGAKIPEFLKIDHGYLTMIMHAFPNVWASQDDKNDTSKLLKVSQVARMLHKSESKVRSLAQSGKLKFTRSQGEVGHYRFKPEWVLAYVESTNV